MAVFFSNVIAFLCVLANKLSFYKQRTCSDRSCSFTLDLFVLLCVCVWVCVDECPFQVPPHTRAQVILSCATLQKRTMKVEDESLIFSKDHALFLSFGHLPKFADLKISMSFQDAQVGG